MKMCGRIWSVSLVLILAALTLAGCGRRAIRDRSDASATEAITIEMQAQPQNTAPQQKTQVQAEQQAESAAQAATPTAQPPTNAIDDDMNKLMDELQTVLDELDETIKETDLDALTDANLSELGK